MAAEGVEAVRARVAVTMPATGATRVDTGLPVLDHALTLFALHARIDLEVDVAAGASAEEIARVGRVLGERLAGALAARDARGHGSATVPADEALAYVALEASGRPLLVSNVDLTAAHVGGLATDLISGLLRELTEGAGLTLHVRLLEGEDTQHVLDAIFKSLGSARGAACAPVRRPAATEPSNEEESWPTSR